MIRTPEQVRADLLRKGISVSQWAASNGFSGPLVFQVLKGKRQCVRGQSHNIAVALGLKEGEICHNAADALSRAVA